MKIYKCYTYTEDYKYDWVVEDEKVINDYLLGLNKNLIKDVARQQSMTPEQRENRKDEPEIKVSDLSYNIGPN